MAWDVKATAMAVADAVPSQETLTGLQHTLGQLASNLMQSWFTIAVIATIFLLVFAPTPFSRRVKSTIVESFFTNWQLALLGSAAVLLSLVSGYTTFDGMRNFTGGGMISALATFGIQGVMLVTAWLIGESFATGMSQRVPGQPARRAADPWIAGVLGVALAGAVFYWLLRYYDASLLPGSTSAQVSRFSDIALYFAMALIVVAIIFLNRKGDIALPYVQSTRVIAKNMILWVMFFACMAVSVFFSFDSHFSGIFPAEERKRAAEIRSINQVAGVVADIGSRIQTRRIDEAQRLFDTDAWAAYEKELEAVTKLATESPRLMREQLARELEEQKSRVAALEEKRANAQSNQAGLATRKTALTEELSRIIGERPEVATAVQQQKAVVAEVEKRLDEQKAKTMAEEKGVEGSGKVGQGQFWRAAKAEEVKVQSELQVARERLRPMETRLSAIDKRSATIKAELAQIDGDLAKLRGEADTAGQMIGVAQSAKAGEGQSVDPAAATNALERARQAFRQKPEAQGLADIQSHCATLVSTAGRVASLKDEAARIDCDPKQASEAAARVFALNQGLAAFAATCAGGDKLPQSGGTDGMLTFGRKCLQESGLPSKDTSEFGARLSALDLSRDDKAHRFVVTWNAFQDGNRLAYLALAIAITIDSMIFIAGLFGANAVRSPLSDVPSIKARSATQLEAIVDTALLPHKLDNARLVLGAMKPMTQRDGFMARVTVDDHDPHAPELRRVLNAGSTIGAVRHADEQDHVYEIRAELFEYLSVVAKREFEANKENVSLADLERTVSVALLPDIAYGAETVLAHMHPIREDRGFMAEVRLEEVRASDDHSGRQDTRIVRSALNAGATFDRVQRVGASADHYYIHADFYRTLTRIRARLMSSAATRARIAGPSGGSTFGGDLTERAPAIAAEHRRELPKPDSAQRPRAVVAEAPRPAAPPPAASAAAGTVDNQLLYNRFVTRLLRAAEIEPAAFKLIAGQGLAPAATETARVLDMLKSAGTRLGREIDFAERRIEDLIHRQYEILRREHESAPDSLPTLDQAYEEVRALVPALMVAPGGTLERVIDQMIFRLETAAAPDEGLPDDDHHLLQRLRDLRERLRGNDRQSTQAWEQAAFILSTYNEDPTRVAMPRVASFRPH